jgi:hypothetical protein
MEIRAALCRRASVHEAHVAEGTYMCPGWTQHDKDVTDLATMLEGLARRHLPGDDRPKLECHPSVRHELMQYVTMDYHELMGSINSALALGETPFSSAIDVIICPDLPKDGWKIVTASGVLS